MNNLTATRIAVIERSSWDFQDEAIVSSSHNSPQEILEAFAASLLESDPANRLVVTVQAKYRDELGNDFTVGLNVLIDTALPVSYEHNVWAFAGLDRLHPEHRVELLFHNDGLVLVNMTKTSVICSSGASRTAQPVQG
ncbi:MAG TPA: hypothetical protein VLI05_01145 [Candidatus Saccharimonadia bacterium]|nr:hypothetical protein [Candidatus Saccharimonadia bacterium]